MKITKRKDGNYTFTAVPEDLALALSHIAGDLGAGNCILRYDKKLYDPWARPNKATRKALVKFSAAVGQLDTTDEWAWWFDQFDVLDKPEFARRKDK